MRGSFDLSKTIYSKIASVLPNKADKNLGNVANGDFLNKMKANGFISGYTKIKLITPITFMKKAIKDDATVNISNGGKGIFIFSFDDGEIHGINDKKGSYFFNLSSPNPTSSSWATNKIQEGYYILIVDGINKPLIFDRDYLYYYFDFVLPSLTSFNTHSTSVSGTNIKVIKIAEIL